MVNKTISIPYEIDQKLKEETNASFLITTLLKNHYQTNNIKNLTIEEIDKLIEIEQLKENFNNKMKELGQ